MQENKPEKEITENEQWLFNNAEAKAQLQKGLQDAAERKISMRGSFAEYADDKIAD